MLAAFQKLQELASEGLPILDLHPAYENLLVDFDPLAIDPRVLVEQIAASLVDVSSVPERVGRMVDVPVKYGGSHGPDLETVAEHAGLSTSEVVRLHSQAEYVVAFVGFQPGFPYLIGLPEVLSIPRLSVPRLKVPKGSVAIGGSQTGIYPESSPGGWRLIGHTDLRLFDSASERPSLFAPGDRVRFVPMAGESS